MRFTFIPAFVAMTVLLATGCATRPQPAQPPVPRNITAEVAAEFEQSVAAWNAGNLDAFVSIYAESATFALPESFLQGRMAIREFYAPNFDPRAPRDALEIEQLHVEVLSPDVALVRGTYRNSQGGQITRRGTTTLILRRFPEGWRIVHDHSS